MTNPRIKTWLLDHEPVTEAELIENANPYLLARRAQPTQQVEIAVAVLKYYDHEVAPIPEEEQTAECPWPERLPK